MPKSNRQPTATEIAAAQSVTPEARSQFAFQMHEHGDRDKEGDVIDGHHLRRLACCKALELSLIHI